jgi:hypothetical protein
LPNREFGVAILTQAGATVGVPDATSITFNIADSVFNPNQIIRLQGGVNSAIIEVNDHGVYQINTGCAVEAAGGGSPILAVVVDGVVSSIGIPSSISTGNLVSATLIVTLSSGVALPHTLELRNVTGAAITLGISTVTVDAVIAFLSVVKLL